MNCKELTDSITNIKAQLIELDVAVGARDPKEAINIKNDIIKQFNGELKEYIDTFYTNPTPENYDKEVGRIISKIEDEDPLEVMFSRKELILIYDTDDKAKLWDFSSESRSIIKTIREKRNSREDILIIYKCLPYEIAWVEDFISPGAPIDRIKAWAEEYVSPETKIYIGPLFPGIFDLPNLEHIYTSFPESEVRRGEFVTCGKTGQELLDNIETQGIDLGLNGKEMLLSINFVVQDAKETINTIRLKVSDLFPDGQEHSYPEIRARAKELGLTDNLPHETVSALLLNELTLPKLCASCRVASKPIDLDDSSFHVIRDSYFMFFFTRTGPCLSNEFIKNNESFFNDRAFMFRFTPAPERH